MIDGKMDLILLARPRSTRLLRMLSSSSPPNPYAILGIKISSSPKEIRLAYLAKAKVEHPDAALLRGEDAVAEATRRFKNLNAAHEVLRDPSRRAEWDRRAAAFSAGAADMTAAVAAADAAAQARGASREARWTKRAEERRLRRATLPSRRVVLALFAAAVAVSGTIELSKAANAALEKKIRRQ